jgi:hypothetical protein
VKQDLSQKGVGSFAAYRVWLVGQSSGETAAYLVEIDRNGSQRLAKAPEGMFRAWHLKTAKIAATS